MPDPANQAVDDLRSVFAPLGSPEAAESMSAYMRDRYEYFGIKSPPRRAAQAPIVRAMAKEPVETILDFSAACWEQDEREFQYVACELLRKVAKRLEPEHLVRVQELIMAKSWWDTIDSLASRVVGPLVKRHDLADVMDEWIEHENLWVARCALLHQMFWKEDTDEIRLFDYCERQLEHPDFFIRKAIGWALRQYAYIDPDAVHAFVEQHADTMAPLSRREALKHIG